MHTEQKHNTMNWWAWGAAMAVGLSAILISGLIALRTQPAAVSLPRPIAPPHVVTAAPQQPMTRNRIFQDEINAAATLDLGDPTSLFSPWPERLSDLRPATPSPIARPASPARPQTTNRIFLDEIAGAQGVSDGTYTPAPGEITPREGPR
jgi:hypothetical protein